MSNLDKYKDDLIKLISDGNDLLNAMSLRIAPDSFEASLKKTFKTQNERETFKKSLPRFSDKYQDWYSESMLLVKLLLPDRLDDFKKLFEKPKTRKSIEYGNYVIEDYLQGLVVHSGIDRKVGPEAAYHQFEQQLNIVKSVQRRFESSLFDIRQLVQADLLDSELEASKELNKNGFSRAAGAVTGVVLESHLSQVCKNHNLKISGNSTISTLNSLLKENNVYDTATWRQIQYLGDLRNKCDHKKTTDPTEEEIKGLIDGVEKITKTIF